MAVITISRQLGSNGEEVAQSLSERLGFVLIDRKGLEHLVLEYGLDEGDLDQIQERAPSFWERLLSDRKLYLDLVDSFIRDKSEKENFILLGRGGQCIFQDFQDALHVRFFAFEETRMSRTIDVLGPDREHALESLREAERNQARFIQSLYGRKIDDPLLYDIILSTDRLDVQACVQIIVNAVGQRSLTVHLPETERSEPPGTVTQPSPNGKKPAFSNTSEEEFARILDFYQIQWEFEPKTFPLEWDGEGRVTEAFSPDFYLVDSDTFIELTTLKQSLVTKKNRKLRRLKKLYPDVNVRIFYRRDFHNLLNKYGLNQMVGNKKQ